MINPDEARALASPDIFAMLASPPTSPRGYCSYIALSFNASRAWANRLRKRCYPAPVAVFHDGHSAHLVAIMASPMPVENAIALRDRIATMADKPVAGSAPCLRTEAPWQCPRVSASARYSLMLAIAGRVDLEAMTANIHHHQPASGVVETLHGGNIYVWGHHENRRSMGKPHRVPLHGTRAGTGTALAATERIGRLPPLDDGARRNRMVAGTLS